MAETKFDPNQRATLIRKGNEYFNNGNYLMAGKIFRSVHYRDGLIRVGDYIYFTLHKPLLAMGYYRDANHTKMLERIKDGFAFALKCWLDEDTSSHIPTDTLVQNPPGSKEGDFHHLPKSEP